MAQIHILMISYKHSTYKNDMLETLFVYAIK